jgi:hypothetical protein
LSFAWFTLLRLRRNYEEALALPVMADYNETTNPVLTGLKGLGPRCHA